MAKWKLTNVHQLVKGDIVIHGEEQRKVDKTIAVVPECLAETMVFWVGHEGPERLCNHTTFPKKVD